MPRFNGEAALVPLEYTGTSGSRPEFALVFLCNDWDKMIQVVQAPGQFLTDLKLDFSSIDPTLSRGFAVEEPVTIQMFPLTLSRSMTSLVLGQWISAVDFDDKSKLEQGLLLTDKAFVVEVALETRTILVGYNPAKRPTRPTKYFSGQLTSQTLSRIIGTDSAGNPAPTPVGHLHFDIDFSPLGSRPTQAQIASYRAALAIDFIESSGQLTSLLTKVFAADTKLYPTGGPLRTSTRSATEVSVTFKSPKNPRVTLDSILPTVGVVPSSGEMGAVCGDQQVYYSGSEIELGDLLLKGYHG